MYALNIAFHLSAVWVAIASVDITLRLRVAGFLVTESEVLNYRCSSGHRCFTRLRAFVFKLGLQVLFADKLKS